MFILCEDISFAQLPPGIIANVITPRHANSDKGIAGSKIIKVAVALLLLGLGLCIVCAVSFRVGLGLYCNWLNTPQEWPIYPSAVLLEEKNLGVTRTAPVLMQKYETSDSVQEVYAFYEDNSACYIADSRDYHCFGISGPYGDYYVTIYAPTDEVTSTMTSFSIEVRWHGGCVPVDD